MLRDVFYYGKKPNVHPREKLAISIADARQQATTEHFWIINEYCDYRNFDWDFDFEFLPDEDVWAEEHNNVWPSQHQKDSGTWLCPKEHSDIIIYRADVDTVKRKNEKNDNWILLDLVDETKFDFSWHPDPSDPPYIYSWGCKYFPVELQSCLEYHVHSATAINYMNTIVELLPQTERWVEVQEVDKNKFDMSWRPSPLDPPMNYVWGNKFVDGKLKSTLEYHMPGATDTKYMTDLLPVLPEYDRYQILIPVDETSFDFAWRPDPREPDYIYVWGNQSNDAIIEPTIEYHCLGASERKYMNDKVAKTLPVIENWKILIPVDNFDFSWRPNPREPDYIYVWGSKWNQVELEPVLEYHAPNATDRKYMEQVVELLPNLTNWYIPKNINVSKFDFSWRPNPTSPPYIYQFGTLLDKEDGPKYVHPDATDEVIVYLERVDIAQPKIIPKYIIQTTLADLVKQHPDEIFWALHDKIDYTAFDFEWRPEIVNVQWENEYVYVFGSLDSEITQTYFVNASMYLKGHTDFKFVQIEELTETYLSTLFKKPDMFFIDKSNSESQLRFEKLKQQFPTIQKTRYLNSWVDTINRCITRSTTELCWILNSELDYTDFDFNYYPNPWQMKMVHVFGTQWSHWGTTYIVNRETFAHDTKYIKIIEHLSNLNFVKQRRAKATNILYDIIYINHGNLSSSEREDKLVFNYEQSYLETFKKILENLPIKKEHYVWIVSSICDYTHFDFTYICDPFAKEQLHVFPSDRQKFGDTFLIDVNKLRVLIADMNTLEDYTKINYNQHQRVKRLSAPVIVTEGDSHVSSINTTFDFPYAVFVTEDSKDISVIDIEPMNLWSNETKTITVTSKGGTRIIVPKEAKQHVKKELYDYPYITTTSKLTESNPLDIIFFSNGEASADKNYEHLLKITQGLPNKVIRIDGINGRVKSQHAAANSSNTSWYFLVNAKLKVAAKFDFSWQPDRLQISKHYIFHATNPVNGLVYGHQAIVANNKKLTLENFGNGLDFTMDSEHEVVPINSGIGMYNSSEWDTWRTAFRECIKLKASGTEENDKRLDTWLTVGIGEYSQYSLQGAQHAVHYYNEVNGDFDKLRLSYDWAWLRTHYESKYNNVSL